MRSTRLRMIMGFAAVTIVGMLYQTACIGFGGDQLLRTVDFCFLFDCQNGAIGGLLDPCTNRFNAAGESTNLFVDCPPEANN